MPPENPNMDVKPPLAIPVNRPRPKRATWLVRGGLLAVAAVLAGVFAIAFTLNPYNADGSARTMATHRQLGMPPCNFVVLTGKPCPSCGMTTSFALLVRGDIGASLRANWVGTLLALFWVGLMAWAAASGLKGRPLFVPRGRGELITTVIVGGFLVLMVGRWVGVLIGGG